MLQLYLKWGITFGIKYKVESFFGMLMATVSAQKSSKSLLEIFSTTRERTLELVQTLEKDDFVVQTAFYTSPPKWHLGHVSWLYEVVMNKTNSNYQFYSRIDKIPDSCVYYFKVFKNLIYCWP